MSEMGASGASGDGGEAIPRGVETLIQRAAVDPAFRAILCAERAGAAEAIGLDLEEAEEAILRDIAPGHLEALIDGVRVEPDVARALAGDSMAEIGPALEETSWPENAPRRPREVPVGGIRPGLFSLIRRIFGG